MSTPKRTSVIVLITLAELAWLAAFALLFAYRSKVGELGKLRHDYNSETNKVAKLLVENQRLQGQLSVFQKFLGDVPPDEAARRLVAAAELAKKISAAEEREKELRRKLVEKTEEEKNVRAELANAQTELEKLRIQLAATDELNEKLTQALARGRDLEKQLLNAQTEIRQREVGEFSIRRELTGLPDGNLRRVIFIVDSSGSMKNSPAWESARKLIRTWLEFLPVEECVLVNFNDTATGFPEKGYQLVRQADGTKLPEKREEFLRVFDQIRSGTYTDLLRGLRRAYDYPPADVMVLFTDGHPHIATKGDAAFASEILKEVAKHRGIPILTVAVGSYEVEGAEGPKPKINAPIAFLKELAHQTGGNFLAR